jgi:hypothetical protein
MTLILVILILVLLFGGGFFGYNRGYYGGRSFGGLLGFLVVLFILYLLFGGGLHLGGGVRGTL